MFCCFVMCLTDYQNCFLLVKCQVVSSWHCICENFTNRNHTIKFSIIMEWGGEPEQNSIILFSLYIILQTIICLILEDWQISDLPPIVEKEFIWLQSQDIYKVASCRTEKSNDVSMTHTYCGIGVGCGTTK